MSVEVEGTLYHLLPFVSVFLNGEGPFEFVLDTGMEQSTIDRGLSDEIGLSLGGESVEDAPGGAVSVGVTGQVQLSSAGTPLLEDAELLTLPLVGIESVLGHPVQGILGFDLFADWIVEIDYAAGSVRLFEPSEFAVGEGFRAVPMLVEERELFVDGALVAQAGREPIPGKLKFDTGSASGLGLNGSFVQATHLVSSDMPKLRVLGAALGGSTENFVVRIHRFDLGPFSFHHLPAGFSADTERAGDAGTLGGEILTRFTVVVDQPGARVLLQPNGSYSDPFPYDRSGLMLRSGEARTVLVADVIEASPAAEAGLLAGDTVLAIDGRASTDWTLATLRDFLSTANRVALLTDRDGEQFSYDLELRPLI